MADRIPDLGLTGPTLVVDDDAGLTLKAVTVAGLPPYTWYRRALRGQHATPWVVGGPFDNAIVRLPLGREALEMVLHAVASTLRPRGLVFIYGANDEGIRSAGGTGEPLFGEMTTVDTRRHCRVLMGARLDEIPTLRGELAAWRREVVVDLSDGPVQMVSYPGVFAHGKVDAGTRMLLSVFPVLPAQARVLDFGCGIGVLGAEALRRSPGAQVDMLDVSALAIEAARENVPGARMILGEGWSPIPNSQYDLVVSNPPIHTGKGQDFRVLADFVDQLPAHLRKSGEVLLVVQRTVPVQRLLQEKFGTVERVTQSPQYSVWRGANAKSTIRLRSSSRG